MSRMSLTSNHFLNLVAEARKLILREFNVHTSAKVELCTEIELAEIILDDAQRRNLSKQKIQHIMQLLPFLYGKYFLHSHTAYVILGRGDNLAIIIHELLHSIQLCASNREDIVDYISYKLTNETKFIDPALKREWEELERIYTWEKIKHRLLIAGNCEDFDW